MTGNDRSAAMAEPRSGRVVSYRGRAPPRRNQHARRRSSATEGLQLRCEMLSSRRVVGVDNLHPKRDVRTDSRIQDLQRIHGCRSEQIQASLGHVPYSEVIHRDNLVLG